MKQEKIALVACSNGQSHQNKDQIERLAEVILQLGFIPVWSRYLYEIENGLNGSAQAKAEECMSFYDDKDIIAIFDISGGDIANELLPYLDYKKIAKSSKRFYGYSDLTTILNAIYAQTGQYTGNYQIRNLIYADSENQKRYFLNMMHKSNDDLFDLSYEFIQGHEMKGIVVGGNIRCFLKLAGTQYWPDMQDKILLLEAYSGKPAQMVTYFSQLKQIGVFEQIKGILLGTFTQMEKENYTPSIQELVKKYVKDSLPIACTKQIGHGVDAKAIMIGKEYDFKSK